MIGDLVSTLVLTLFGGAVGTWISARAHRRKAGRAFAAGREVLFPGGVLGEARYCHPEGGVLAVGDATLTWLTGYGGKRYPVPHGQLRVERLEPGRAWGAGEMTDVLCEDVVGGGRVTLRVSTRDLPYLATVLPLGPDVAPAVRGTGGGAILGR